MFGRKMLFCLVTLTKRTSVINKSSKLLKNGCSNQGNILCGHARTLTDQLHPPPGVEEPPIPPYTEKQNETIEIKRARLLYQSRKRGMTENGLLLSTFAAKYLNGLSENQLLLYDRLINQPTNDWEIYYWVTGAKPTPPEYDHEVMNMLKEHTRNTDRNTRLTQPDLY